MFLNCDILWCIIYGVLRYLVSYFWCFVVYSYLSFLVLSCGVSFVMSCDILFCLVVSCWDFFVESCGFILFLIWVSCCMLFVESCSFLFLICGRFSVTSTYFLICNNCLCFSLLYF